MWSLQHLSFELKYFVLCFIPGNQTAKAAREPSFGAAGIKPKPNASLPPPTPTRTPIMGLPHASAYRRRTLQDAKLTEGIDSVQFNPNWKLRSSLLYLVATGSYMVRNRVCSTFTMSGHINWVWRPHQGRGGVEPVLWMLTYFRPRMAWISPSRNLLQANLAAFLLHNIQDTES